MLHSRVHLWQVIGLFGLVSTGNFGNILSQLTAAAAAGGVADAAGTVLGSAAGTVRVGWAEQSNHLQPSVCSRTSTAGRQARASAVCSKAAEQSHLLLHLSVLVIN